MVRVKVPRPGVDEAGVVENGRSRFLYDRHGVLDGKGSHALAAQRFAVDVSGADLAVIKAAQVVRAAQKEPIVDTYPIAVAPNIDRRGLRAEQKDRIFREMEILARFKRDPENLLGAAERSARDIRRQNEAVPTA